MTVQITNKPGKKSLKSAADLFRDHDLSETAGDKLERSTYSQRDIITRVWREHLSPHLNYVIIALIAMTITAAMTGAIPLILEKTTKGIFIDKRQDLVIPLTIIVVIITILKTSTEYIRNVTMAYLGQKFVANIRRSMVRKLTYGDLAWIEETPSGQFVSAFLNDANLVHNTASRLLVALGENLLKVIFLAGVMLYLDWRLALLVLIFMPVGVFLMKGQRQKMDKSSRKTMKETGGLSSLVIQLLRSIRAVRAYGQEEREIAEAGKIIDRSMEFAMRSNRARAISSPIVELLTGLGFAAAIYFGAKEGLTGDLELGAFMGFMASAMLIYQPLKALATLQMALQEGVAAASRVFGVIDQPQRILEAKDAKDLLVKKGKITFKGVEFAYIDENDSEHNTHVFSKLTLTIPAGKTVALVGPSGAGKSTLMNLVLRFYDPQKGSVLIDDQDISQVTSQSLRSAIALVTQDPLIFDDSLANNIRYGREDASLDEIKQAAKAAAAHEFISNMPGGYDSQAGEAGNNLSGGEKQRITIARAILKDAPILLLDEPTSALDSKSESLFQEALETLMKKRTVLMIAHRLSTVKKADLILVLKDGKIVERGTHDKLLEKQGLYHQLYQSQFEQDNG